MRVLVACEYSGVVRDAFLALGHDAMSCDLLPTDSPGPHYTGDVFDIIGNGWDLMVAHPPCTYATAAGARWLYEQGTVIKIPERWNDLRDGAEFFRALWEADIPRIAIENPVMMGYAKVIIGRGKALEPTCFVDPWQHGHPEQKHTGLWLKGLSPLVETDNVYDHMMTLPKNQRQRIWSLPPSVNRWKLRSTTYAGIAAAMADQWTQPDLFTVGCLRAGS
jgi:hypothetical protein